jgi:hypothetical protein
MGGPVDMPNKLIKKKRAPAKRGKLPAKLRRNQLAWLKAAGRVVREVVRLPSIDAESFAGIVATLKVAEAEGQDVKRYYYIDLRGARGIAKVEATLKGG